MVASTTSLARAMQISTLKMDQLLMVVTASEARARVLPKDILNWL
jgi:hypothetical protein